MKILVFMSDNRCLGIDINTAEYNALSACINAEYCKKHGYDFIYYRPYLTSPSIVEINNCLDPKSGDPRHSSWSKLLSASLAIEKSYDYIVYIDSDCIFKNFNSTLESFIQPHTEDILFLNDRPFDDKKPCAGFFICKVTDHSKKFLRDWYSVDLPNNNTAHPWEQAALYTLYKNYSVKVIDGYMFVEHEGQLLRHIGTHDGENRVPYFKSFITTHKFDFPKAILGITFVEYSTKTTSKQNGGRRTRRSKRKSMRNQKRRKSRYH